jgi:ferredoxin
VIKRALYILFFISVCVLCADALGVERFPPPEFDTHQLPSAEVPPARNPAMEYLDAAVLALVLLLAAWLVLKKRSRRWIFSLMIFSMVYFGFYRKGCICSIGAIGNVCLSLFDGDYAMPAAVVLFFILPLVVTLFFGRVFCGSVCPLGAIQDVFLLKPIAVPGWLERGLRVFAYVYLAAAVLFAATGSAFVICRYDPFIGFFRLSGSFNIIVLGVCFLVVGVFVGRPYCRFLCPYGVILRQFSKFSKFRVTITPDECIKCRLCEDACPFGAIDKPTADWTAEDYSVSKKRLGIFLLLLPVLMAVLGGVGFGISDKLSRSNATVRLADRIYLEEAKIQVDTTDASAAFRSTGESIESLYERAKAIQAQFAIGSVLCGVFIGLVIGVKLILESIRFKRDEYQANKSSCLACGRCYEYCPVGKASVKGEG